jgi:hypothetical protein
MNANQNVIHELWNESLEDHDWSTVIKPYHETLAPKIRALDRDNLIVLGTQTWSQDVDKAGLDPVRGENLATRCTSMAARTAGNCARRRQRRCNTAWRLW